MPDRYIIRPPNLFYDVIDTKTGDVVGGATQQHLAETLCRNMNASAEKEKSLGY